MVRNINYFGASCTSILYTLLGAVSVVLYQFTFGAVYVLVLMYSVIVGNNSTAALAR